VQNGGPKNPWNRSAERWAVKNVRKTVLYFLPPIFLPVHESANCCEGDLFVSDVSPANGLERCMLKNGYPIGATHLLPGTGPIGMLKAV